jgi:Zn-dependent protease with chaperone function
MTPAAVALALTVLLLLGAVLPAVPRRAGPAFSARPRLGIAVWTGATVAWTAGVLALGPLLAWTVTGPALPGAVGDVCRRCLVASSPFGPPAGGTAVPVFVLLLVPALLAGWLGMRTARDLVRARRTADDHLTALIGAADRRLLVGAPVWVLPEDRPAAYSLPGRRGVVVTEGGLKALSGPELAAVLGHERAHVRQRHHTVLTVLGALGGVLGRVPLVGRAGPAVAHYAEMAADDAARRVAGTRALAGALLALGEREARAEAGPALHAAGSLTPWRTARLVSPPAPPSGWGLAAVAAYLAAVVAVVVLVVVPYGTVLVTGSC